MYDEEGDVYNYELKVLLGKVSSDIYDSNYLYYILVWLSLQYKSRDLSVLSGFINTSLILLELKILVY